MQERSRQEGEEVMGTGDPMCYPRQAITLTPNDSAIDHSFAIEKKVDTMTAILRDLLAEQTTTQMAPNKLYERLGGVLARLDGER